MSKAGTVNPFYGKRHTEEAKERISQSRKGKAVGNQNALGSRHTEEAKAKKSVALRAFYASPEGQALRAQMSEQRKGNKHNVGRLRSEEAKAKTSGSLKEFYASTDGEKLKEHFEVVRQGNKNALGYRHTEDAKARMSAKRAGANHPMYGRHQTEEAKSRIRSKVSQLSKALWASELYREKVRDALIAYCSTPEGRRVRLQVGAVHRALWQLPSHRDKRVRAVMLALHIHPNKPESKLLALLNTVEPNRWQFVGDGKLVVAGKNPDFSNGDHKLAELFGDYWHQGQNPEERVKLFKKEGYETLIVWEHELKQKTVVLEKIRNFCQSPS